MGGRGSGNHYPTKSAILTTDFLELDLRVLKKRGWLKPNATTTLTWSRNGKQTGQISYVLEQHTITLHYNYRQNGSDWQSIEDPIKLIKTPCHFGGERTWFNCPSCSSKALVLYGGKYFRCRKCKRAVHPSVNEAKYDRSRRALARYQEKLAPDIPLSAYDGVRELTKPKWMRYKTYFDIKYKGAEKEDEVNRYFIAAADKLI